MTFSTDLSNMPRDRVIMAWLDESEWAEAIKWEEYDQESKDEIGSDGYWRYADELLCDVAGEIELSEILGWAELPEKPIRDVAV